jgi:hypothetical protein
MLWIWWEDMDKAAAFRSIRVLLSSDYYRCRFILKESENTTKGGGKTVTLFYHFHAIGFEYNWFF